MLPQRPAQGGDVLVIGAGLAGSLLALALAERGLAVRLVAPDGCWDPALSPQPAGDGLAATALSYGAMAGGRAARLWQRLERRHGSLGWRSSRLVPHVDHRPLAALPAALLAKAAAWFPLSRVDGPVLAAALPAVLARAGVVRQRGWVTDLQPAAAGGWSVGLDPGGRGGPDDQLAASQVVLAAGSGCRALWPDLPPGLRSSWAGVLLADDVGASPWLEQVRRGRMVMPCRWRLPDLEQGGAGQPAVDLPAGDPADRWVVDPGLTPRGAGVLLGQISLLRAGGDAGAPPDPGWMEDRLRQGLARLDPQLARLPGRYRQVPVPFCSDAVPLVGAVADAPGLWVFTGFSGAFSQVPVAADHLAARLAGWLNPPTA